MNTCKILSWNVWEGIGVQSRDGQFCVDDQRLKLMREVIAQTTPDVMVLNEALFCQAFDSKMVNYRALLGFEHAVCDLYHKEWGNAILSNRAVHKHKMFRIYNRGGMWASIGSTNNPLTIATYHPHPSRYPSNKAQDFKTLLQDVQGACVVCGDFNAISPEDDIDEVAMTQAFARFSSQPATDLARFTAGGRSVFNTLTDLGYEDSVCASQRSHTIPSDALSTNKDSAMRIDHAWIKNIASCHTQVINTPQSNHASDHLPLLIEVSW